MRYQILISVFSLASAWSRHAAFAPKGANCLDYIIPLTVTSDNRPWTGPRWEDDFGFIDFLSSASTRFSAGFPSPVGDPVKQTCSYEISATFCTPQRPGNHSKTVLLATHGLGFDKSYWNFPYQPEQYSFVQFAINRGYSVFFYDRLGVGRSTKISGFDNQLAIGISILSSLAKSIRSGEYTTIGTPKSLVLVGHSFGSWSSNGLLALEPDSADAVILTGYGLNGGSGQLSLEGFAPRVARFQRPRSFIALDPGYITTKDVFSNIHNFFKGPAYDRDVARYSELTKQPFAISEFYSLLPQFVSNDAANFTGPALIITGEFDFIICGGYCPGVLDEPLRTIFRGSSNFEAYVQPKAGHGTNLATNATGFYGVIFDFLGKHGI